MITQFEGEKREREKQIERKTETDESLPTPATPAPRSTEVTRPTPGTQWTANWLCARGSQTRSSASRHHAPLMAEGSHCRSPQLHRKSSPAIFLFPLNPWPRVRCQHLQIGKSTLGAVGSSPFEVCDELRQYVTWKAQSQTRWRGTRVLLTYFSLTSKKCQRLPFSHRT